MSTTSTRTEEGVTSETELSEVSASDMFVRDVDIQDPLQYGNFCSEFRNIKRNFSSSIKVVLFRPLDGVKAARFVGHVQFLKRECKGRVETAHAQRWRLEILKAALRHHGHNLGSHSKRLLRLVRHDQTASLANAAEKYMR